MILTHRTVRCRLQSEFGLCLSPLVAETPGAQAAILSDAEGYPIDFVHIPDEQDELDVQLLGAQIGQAMLRVTALSIWCCADAPTVVLESSLARIVASVIARQYILAFRLQPNANLGAALGAYTTARKRLEALL